MEPIKLQTASVIEFIDIATEQTTAATDAILTIFSLFIVFSLIRMGKNQPWKSYIWSVIFGLFSIAAVLGSVAHGFKMSASLNALLWHPINLALGLMISLFVVATSYDIWGKPAVRRILLPMLAIGIFFFGLTMIWPDSFLVFIIYEFLATLFALAGYTWSDLKKSFPGAWLMAMGILLSIVAAGVQASGMIRFTLVWDFDHNGAFHLIQMIAFVFLFQGLKQDLTAKAVPR